MNNVRISIAARALAIGMVAALMLVGTAMGEVSRTGLIAEYHFEGDAKDSSGYRNDGTIYGATFVQGISGQALSFDGRNNGVKATGSFTFSTSNQITIEAWFKLTGHESYDGIVSSEGCCLYRLMVDPQLNPFYNPGTHTDIPVTTFTFETGKWYHYAMTIGSRTAKIYVDGSEISSSTSGVPTTLPDITSLLIGNGETIGTWPAQAIIDEVRIYNRALTASEIQAEYNALTSTPTTVPPTTVPPTTIVTPTPQIIVITQPSTPQITQPTATPKPVKFRVGPSVTLRPVTDVIEENQDGIVELFMNNPSLNDVTLNVDAQVSVPAGLHVYGENFGEAAGAGVVAGTFSVPPGKARTISIAIKADKSARKGSHTLQFTGLYYPDGNKDAFQPISLTYAVTVERPSKEIPPTVTPTPIATPTPKVLIQIPGFEVILAVIGMILALALRRR